MAALWCSVNRFAERSLHGRTGQEQIDTRNEISQQLAKGQLLDSCRQKTAFPVPVGQTQVLAETPLERRKFLPARRSNQ
jgi:hypothetical protein